jgi:hypothetical protein
MRFWSVADPAPYLHQSEKLEQNPDPDPHLSQNVSCRGSKWGTWTLTGGVKAQNGAVDCGGFVDQWSQICITLVSSMIRIQILIKRKSRIWIPILIKVKSLIQIRIKVKIRIWSRIKVKSLIRIRIKSKRRIRIRFKVKRGFWIRIKGKRGIRIRIKVKSQIRIRIKVKRGIPISIKKVGIRDLAKSLKLCGSNVFFTANEVPVRINYKCLVPIYVFPEMKLLFPKQNYNLLSPSSYTNISVRDLHISRIGLPILQQGNMWTDPGNIHC